MRRRTGNAWREPRCVPTLAETSSDFIGPLNPHIGTMSYPLPERRRVSLLRRLWRYVTNLTQTHCPTC